jgi:hypothetical protein
MQDNIEGTLLSQLLKTMMTYVDNHPEISEALISYIVEILTRTNDMCVLRDHLITSVWQRIREDEI